MLSPEQIEFYHREGYLVVQRLVLPEEVERLRNVYDRLFAERAGRQFGDQFDLGGPDEEGQLAVLPQILAPSRYAPELKEGQFRADAAIIAQEPVRSITTAPSTTLARIAPPSRAGRSYSASG